MEERKGFSKEEKKIMLISHETRLGIRITGNLFKDNSRTLVHAIYFHCSAFICGINKVSSKYSWCERFYE